MGFFGRLFGTPRVPKPSPPDLDHPVFGSIYMDTDNSWFSESTTPLGCDGNPSLSIDGDDNGPFSGSVDTFERLYAEWDTVSRPIADTLLELNDNYTSNSPGNKLADTESLWRSATLLSIGVGPGGSASLTYTFDWQQPGDGHQITVMLEDWECVGVSVDG